jgi:hypothetical protein
LKTPPLQRAIVLPAGMDRKSCVTFSSERNGLFGSVPALLSFPTVQP